MKKKHSLIYFILFIAVGCSEKKEATTENLETKDSISVAPKSYTLQSANLSLKVDPQTGARIASLKIDEKELLYVNRDSNNNNWGSTLWPSPQELWGWPPVPALDNEPYSDNETTGGISLKSKIAEKPKISFTKNFVANPQDTSFVINYTIHNESDSIIKLAAWEITRVPSGGLIFYPKGKDLPKGDLRTQVKHMKNITWFDYDSTTIPSGVPKLFADGSEGWLAFLNNDGNILIKHFEDSPLSAKAPEPENEIELFTDPLKKYTEVEQQGLYTNVGPKESITWKVTWFVRNIPATIPQKPGSPELVSFVRATIGNKK